MRLVAGDSVARIDPDLGAGLAALTWRGEDVLSAGSGRPAGSPFAQAMNLLLPFSNRLSRPFSFGGQICAVPPNLPDEAFPIHGDAFQVRWTVIEAGVDQAVLGVTAGTGPFRYDATVAYRLAPRSLETRLAVTNRADRQLPYGGGFHPWLPRHERTRLRFAATGHWPEDDRHLPATISPVPAPPQWTFDTGAPLPRSWINVGFAGWDGSAEVLQPDHTLTLSAPDLSTLIVYSPGPEAPFFCVEPVSHPVDAHNLPGRPGLVSLAPGQTMTLSLRLDWRETQPGTGGQT